MQGMTIPVLALYLKGSSTSSTSCGCWHSANPSTQTNPPGALDSGGPTNCAESAQTCQSSQPKSMISPLGFLCGRAHFNQGWHSPASAIQEQSPLNCRPDTLTPDDLQLPLMPKPRPAASAAGAAAGKNHSSISRHLRQLRAVPRSSPLLQPQLPPPLVRPCYIWVTRCRQGSAGPLSRSPSGRSGGRLCR